AVQVLQGGKRIPVVKRPGETLSLSCRGSGFTFSCCSMHWIRQPAGKGLEWMGRVYSDASRTDYSSSLVDSSSKVYLQMKNLKTEDTAVYNCARRDTMRHSNRRVIQELLPLLANNTRNTELYQKRWHFI
uniref:Ig-like domain-containing protein n=1 Tax=Haplochromis burtoni TaxID=8153 RepID=A0A3Q3CXY5_HAPBU